MLWIRELNRYLLSAIFLTSFLGGSPLAFADLIELKPFELKLKAKKLSPVKVTLKGETSLSLDQNGQWQYQTNSEKGGIRIKESVDFLMDGSEVKPLKYSSENKFFFFKERKSIEYKYDNNQIKLAIDNKRKTFELMPSMFDPMSFQVELILNLPKTGLSEIYSVFRYNKPVKYQFSHSGIEWLNTPMGKLETLKLKQTKGNRKAEEKYMWLATNWNYVPVKFQNFKDGQLVDLIEATSGRVDGKVIKGK